PVEVPPLPTEGDGPELLLEEPGAEAGDLDPPRSAVTPVEAPSTPEATAEAAGEQGQRDARLEPAAVSEGSSPAPRPPARAASAPAQRTPVGALFDRINVTHTPEGGMRLEAPPEAAAELAQLLEGLAT